MDDIKTKDTDRGSQASSQLSMFSWVIVSGGKIRQISLCCSDYNINNNHYITVATITALSLAMTTTTITTISNYEFHYYYYC